MDQTELLLYEKYAQRLLHRYISVLMGLNLTVKSEITNILCKSCERTKTKNKHVREKTVESYVRKQ